MADYEVASKINKLADAHANLARAENRKAEALERIAGALESIARKAWNDEG